MSLCFDEAFDALQSHRISEEEYVHHILAHFNGTRHPADSRATRTWESMIRDPVGNAVREAALQTTSAGTDSTPLLEELFLSILHEGAKAANLMTTRMADGVVGSLPIRAIATFAALHGDAGTLRVCLQQGVSLDDRNIAIALEYAARRPALLELLFEYNWRDIRQSRLAFDRTAAWSLHTSPEELSWFLARGATFDQQTIRRAARTAPICAACVQTLIEHLGVGIFRGTGLLQGAAKGGHNDTILILLNAGVDVDEMVASSSCDGGEVELTALYEAVYKQHPDTVHILLQYGADPTKEVGVGPLNTPLRLAEAHDYASLAAILHRSLEKSHTYDRTWTSRL